MKPTVHKDKYVVPYTVLSPLEVWWAKLS